MSHREHQFLRIISGEARGVGSSLARGGLAMAEPFYRGLMAARNRLFDTGWKKTHRASRPVVSVGNLTTGGTGKTPVVAWLADLLRRRLAGEIGILTRGYKTRNGVSDESALLRLLLDDPAAPAVHVLVNPNRVTAASEAIARNGDIKAFIMDDGFQHRRLHRDFDLLLIDATNPLGFGRVLPRGLLRESLDGLRRASAVLVTRVDQVDDAALARIRARLTAIDPAVSVYGCSHVIHGFRQANLPIVPAEQFGGRRIVAFAGIGNPAAFERDLRRIGCNVVGTRWFPDHHAYSAADLQELSTTVQSTSADAVVTTAKDAVKIPDGGPSVGAPIFVAELQIGFLADDGDRLGGTITAAVEAPFKP